MSVAGHYIRTGEGASAELRITSSMSVRDRYHIEGLALWGEDRPSGPNMGTLEFSADLEGAVIRHSEDEERGHEIVITFTADGLEVAEENWVGIYGMNVSFIGSYKRASAIGGFLRSIKLAALRLLNR